VGCAGLAAPRRTERARCGQEDEAGEEAALEDDEDDPDADLDI
jgi:hypothetical protein